MPQKLTTPEFRLLTSLDGIRVFGPHDYGDNTGDCVCGAYMGDARSSAPFGIDPFGACPNNLIRIEKGQTSGMGAPCHNLGKSSEDNVKFIILGRIYTAESQVNGLNEKLKGVEPDKLELAEKVRALSEENGNLAAKIARAKQALD